jgi:excisionase family DNA binding protein
MTDVDQTRASSPRSDPSRPAAELLLRIPEAARVLGVGRTTLYRLIDNGDIRVLRIGRAVRIPVDELQAFVARHHDHGVASTRPSFRTEPIRPADRR